MLAPAISAGLSRRSPPRAKSDDLRTVSWADLQGQAWLGDLRLRIYHRLLQAPATPDEIAAEFRLSILTVRPRCAELRKGLPRHARNPLILAAATGDRRGGAHVLRAIPYDRALAIWQTREAQSARAPAPAPALHPQLALALA